MTTNEKLIFEKGKIAGMDEFFSKCKGTKDLYDKGYSDAKMISGFKHAEKNKRIEELEKENARLRSALEEITRAKPTVFILEIAKKALEVKE